MRLKVLILISAVILLWGTVQASANTLTLWNKLGSPQEITNSIVGPAGSITGTMLFASTRFGNGTKNLNTSSYAWFPSSVIDQTQGTVEFWLKTDFDVVNGKAATGIAARRLLAVTTPASNGVFFIFFDDSAHSKQLRFWISGTSLAQFIPTGTEWSWPAGTTHHIAMVYDKNKGFDSVSTIAVYLDGVKAGTSTVNWGTITGWTGNKLLVCNDLYGAGSPCISDTYIDNLKIWDYAKTNFSDRCSEDGLTACSNTAPSVVVTQPDGLSDTANLSYTIGYNMTDPDDVTTVSLYYDNNNSGYDGTLITSGLPENTAGTYVWNTAGLPNGNYYIYAVANDGSHPDVNAYSTGPVTVYHPGLVLWNKLGSPQEITNSIVGPAGSITGTMLFASTMFGNGTKNLNTSSYAWFPSSVIDQTKGTVEFWLKTDFDVVNGKAATGIAARRLLAVTTPASNGVFFIFFDDSAHSKQLRFWISGTSLAQFIPTGTEWSWPAGTTHHIAMVYDKNKGFDSVSTIAVYLDGVKAGTSTVNWGTITGWTGNKLLVCNDLYGAGSPCISDTYIDNLKIWDYAKTNFSDRCSEDGSVACTNTIVTVPVTVGHPVSGSDPKVDVKDDVCKPGKERKFDIGLNIPKAQRVTIEVYDIQGNLITILKKDMQFDAGYHDLKWELSKEIGSGVYWIVMKGDGWNKRKRVAVIK